MDYNKLSKEAYANAVNHGFHEEKESNEHFLMLVISEIGEMVEAHRNDNKADIELYEDYTGMGQCAFEIHIKDTMQDEMADIAIRLGDLAGKLGIDFNKMNPCRYHRAFDKYGFTDNAFALVKGLCRGTIAVEKRILFGLDYMFKWAEAINVDLPYFIDLKMRYNRMRPMKHGKKY